MPYDGTNLNLNNFSSAVLTDSSLRFVQTQRLPTHATPTLAFQQVFLHLSEQVSNPPILHTKCGTIHAGCWANDTLP